MTDRKLSALLDGNRDDGEDEEGPDATWTLSRLRDFLRAHGGRLSGRKSELVQR